MHSGIVPPKGVWWRPAEKAERIWVTIAFIWCMVLFAMMPLWHFKGGQNPAGQRSRVDQAAFAARTAKFNADYKVGELKGYPVVAPPPGADVYLSSRMWEWSSVLKLEKGVTYTLHLSSEDVNHGFSLYPVNLNLQVVPGYDYALKVTPNQTGEFTLVCNEFCGIGHHNMTGRIIVVEPGQGAAAAGGAK